MRFTSILLLAGTLAILTPAASLANGRIVVIDPAGQMHLTVSGEENFSGMLATARGNVELQEGPVDNLGRVYMLTRLSLQFPDIKLVSSKHGDLTFKHVGLDMRDSLWGYGYADNPLPEGNPLSIHTFTFRNDAHVTFGDPTVRVAAEVTVGEDTDIWTLEDRVSVDIRGRIDPVAGTIEMELRLRGPNVDAPWYAPWVDDLDSEFLIVLNGTFGPGRVSATPRDREKPVKSVELRSNRQ